MKLTIAIRNGVTLATLALIESVHLLILFAVAINFFSPEKYDAAVWNKYFPFLQSAIRPNHDFFLYHCWLISAVAIHLFLVWLFRRRFQEELLPHLRAYLLNETVFLFLLLFAVFKIVVWNAPAWAWALFYTLLILSWLLRIFWLELTKGFAKTLAWVNAIPGISKALIPSLDVMMIILIVILLFPIDMDSILARDFIFEHFHHWDGAVMGAAWSLLSGCRLYVDALCQYGLGMTMMVTNLAQATGGLSYSHVVWIFVYATLVYFVLSYFLLRFWLGSFLLAATGILLGIKFQMFHWGVAPIIWSFPTVTVIRYFLDVFFLSLILFHIRKNQPWSLNAACFCSGLALAYMPDTGLYQWLAFCTYLVYLCKQQKNGALFLYAGIAVLVGLASFTMMEGSVVFSMAFWQGAMQQGNLFLNGFGDLPIYSNLSQGNFFAFFLGLFIPVFYVFSMIWAGSQYALDHRRKENIFIVVLCVYGLGLYHYFICRSALTSYHAVDLPFVYLLMFWSGRILSKVSVPLQRAAKLVIFLLSLGALLTNTLFIYYPNVLNLGHYDWSKEKAYYYQQADVMKEDARLVDQLTDASAKVAVIANGQVTITMEAHRKPLFYFFNFDYPNPVFPDSFSATGLFTYERLKRTLDDMQNAKPAYVFVDAKFFRRQLPDAVYQNSVALTQLMDYLHQYYAESGQQTQDLLALKRKGTV